MIRDRLSELVLALALLVVVWHARRREATVRESLTLSQAWAAAATDDHSPAAATASDPAALTRAAEILDARPEDVPERVEGLDRKVRELTTGLESARANWADRWWDARRAAPLSSDEPHVTVVELPDGELGDAEAIAKRALEDPLGVTIVVAGGDGTLAVAVGADVEDQAAGDIASEVASAAGGGAGGGPDFATGGGDADDLADAAAAVRDRLQTEAGFAA